MFIKRVVIIVIAVLLVGAGFQALRSFLLLRFVDNVNSQKELQDPVSAEIPKGLDTEKYLILYDSKDNNSLDTAKEAQMTLEYMKKDYEYIDIASIEEVDVDSDCILITIERLDYLGGIKEYIDYASGGGSILFLIRPVNDPAFRSCFKDLGILEYEKSLVESKGIRIDTDILTGAHGFYTDSEIIKNSSIDLKLEEECTVHMRSFDEIPLLWEKEIGDGRIVVFNGTMLNEKINRGVVSAALSLAVEDMIYPIIDSKMVHIDDFPAPIPEGNDPKIYAEYQRSIPKFYKEIWWSDMVRYAKQADITYTGFVIENYGDDVKPPFKKASDKQVQNLLVYGKELLRTGGELGLHGYNHQSLALRGHIKQDLGYKPWDNIGDMVESQKALISFISQVFSDYELRAYVPPSNILSPEGRVAIKEANPDLKIISSVYLSNALGDVYTQEFSLASDGIVEFPRLTSGYHYDDETVWTIFNGANLPGVFAHFIHPDDILDPDRSQGKSWSEMTKEFERLLDIVDKEYGWLRSHTVSDAANELIKYLECDIYIYRSPDKIDIYSKDFRESIYCLLKTRKDIDDSIGCDFYRIGDFSYLITLNEPVASIYLEEQ